MIRETSAFAEGEGAKALGPGTILGTGRETRGSFVAGAKIWRSLFLLSVKRNVPSPDFERESSLSMCAFFAEIDSLSYYATPRPPQEARG
ncbi:hypothetical protein BLNAU_9562 [Blattamonas nauphoetae]|uniref:Uncharacterized protein n=1 Tax=Blattamonas nauphoetae TaxID=2049346 RepID=A0ABQ9XQ81_9EUKA|nr:hypothetical protein BLNAU_18895 [Blattamonas nauphoetae]KAK2953669.1 hypothetical protein BLNAU_11390 [Blattamonas nauphoetae]KAK2955515.1 hypothetical protein BLNAU_9562 [Blattamonas nauphoetae]